MMRLTRHDLEAVAEHVAAVEDADVRVNALTVNGLLVTLSCTEHQFDGTTYHVTGITPVWPSRVGDREPGEEQTLAVGDVVTLVPHVGVVTEVGPVNAVVRLASGTLLTVGLTEGLVRSGAS